MKQLNQHIKNKSFAPVYLLYGSESYLKNQYRKKLSSAILPDGSSMNLTYLEGKSQDIPAIIETANTMPFFSEKRLIILENTGFFKSSCELAAHLGSFPDTTILLFIENEVDKKTRMYKEVKKSGCVCEMDANSIDIKELKQFIAGKLSKSGLKISYGTAEYMLMHCGTDLEQLNQELNKLSSYCAGKESVSKEDIESICTRHLANQIFQMIDYISARDSRQALLLYQDLLFLKEKPMGILALIIRHFNKLLLIKDLTQKSTPRDETAKKAGVPPFTIPKYQKQSKSFSSQNIRCCLDYALTQEEKLKKGLINEQIAVELVILYCSRK